jgi:AAA ATPase domain
MSVVALSWPLVGRGGELERVAVARSQGRGAIVVHGAAGVGKSRLAREGLTDAERDGAVTVWVQATRSAASVPLGAFAAVMPSEIRSDDRFELMQRSVQTLRERAGGRPLVLGVDDAQWLDLTSAALVLHLTTTGAAFVVATVRSNEPCPDAIVSLWKDAGGQRLELGLLSQPETETLVEKVVGGTVERGARRWVSETSRGNPLYVRELVLGAVAEDGLKLVSGLWRLPGRPSVSASLIELIAARLGDLTDAQQQALELLALGEPLRLSEMLALTGSEPLAATEARGLVSVDGASGAAEVRLSHPLYGEVIRTELPSLRAREARLRLAETVQARGSLEPEDTLRLARWLIDAGETIPVDLMLEAGRAANLAGDPGFGAALAAQALEAGAGIEAALLLARAHTVQSQFAEAESVLTAAEKTLTTQETALDYLEQQSEVLHWGLNRPSELRELLDRAANWWPDSTWAKRLEPLRLRVASFERLGQSVTASTDILSTADVDAAVRHQVEPTHVGNLFYSGQTHEALELARRIRPTAPLRTLSDAIAIGLWTRVALETGEDWTELETWMTTALEEGIRLGDRATAGQAAYSLACLRFLAGRFVDAGALLAEAELQLEHHDPIGLLLVTNAMQVEVACFSDDRAAIGPALERYHARLGGGNPLAHQLPYVVRADAWAAHADGDPPRAQRLLLDAAAQLSASPVHVARLSYEAMRAGATARTLVETLDDLRARCDARLVTAYAEHAAARAADDGAALLEVVDEMQQIGALRYATEAAAHAADAFARKGREDSARRAAARSRQLLPSGQRGLAPAMAELGDAAVALTPREAQLVQLASRGLQRRDRRPARCLSPNRRIAPLPSDAKARHQRPPPALTDSRPTKAGRASAATRDEPVDPPQTPGCRPGADAAVPRSWGSHRSNARDSCPRTKAPARGAGAYLLEACSISSRALAGLRCECDGGSRAAYGLLVAILLGCELVSARLYFCGVGSLFP